MSYYHAFASFTMKEGLCVGDDVRIYKDVKDFASPQLASIEHKPVYPKMAIKDRVFICRAFHPAIIAAPIRPTKNMIGNGTIV